MKINRIEKKETIVFEVEKLPKNRGTMSFHVCWTLTDEDGQNFTVSPTEEGKLKVHGKCGTNNVTIDVSELLEKAVELTKE